MTCDGHSSAPLSSDRRDRPCTMTIIWILIMLGWFKNVPCKCSEVDITLSLPPTVRGRGEGRFGNAPRWGVI